MNIGGYVIRVRVQDSADHGANDCHVESSAVMVLTQFRIKGVPLVFPDLGQIPDSVAGINEAAEYFQSLQLLNV